MMFVKKNKYFILGIFLLLSLVAYSFYEFYNEYFSYRNTYYKIEDICYKKGKLDNEICKYFRTDSDVLRYLHNNNPNAKWKSYDAITLTSTIVETTSFSCLQFFSPLIIAILLIGKLHDEYSSGMFENYLLRMNYKKYLKNKYKVVFNVSLVMPITLLLIFFISCIVTGFNFDYSNIDKQLSVYSDFKYNHFIIYGTLICFIQFFISWFYSNIALFFLKKHKNKLVAIVMSYVGFLMIYLFIYVVFYCLVLNKLFGIKEMTDYFSITGYWFFEDGAKSYIALIVSIVLQIISSIIIFCSYKSKNGVIMAYEKQTS